MGNAARRGTAVRVKRSILANGYSAGETGRILWVHPELADGLAVYLCEMGHGGETRVATFFASQLRRVKAAVGVG